MSEASEQVEVLEQRMTEIDDTQTNIGGLVEKAARIQAELVSGGFDDYAEKVGNAFSALTMAAEELRVLYHDIELERNRIRNEA